MKALKKLAGLHDNLEAFLAMLSGILIAFVLMAICYEVLVRSWFNVSPIWVVEVSRYALVYIAFLGMAWVQKREEHIRIDLLLARLNPKTRAVLDMMIDLVGAAVFLVVAWYGVKVTLNSYQIAYRMDTELRTPQYIVLACIPIGCFFFFLRFLRGFWGRCKQLAGLGQ